MNDDVYAKVMCEGTPSNQQGWMLSMARHMANLTINRFNSFHKKKAKTNLDLGCGVGEFTRQMQINGFKCVGIDKNPIFVNEAKKRSPPEIEFQCLDFLNYKSTKKYSVVSATHEVFNIVNDYKVFLSKTYELVDNEGFFIFDFITPRGFETWQDIQIQERNDFLMIQKCIYQEELKRGIVKLTGFVQNGNQYDRFDITTEVYNHNLQDVINYAKMIGFKIEIFAEWDNLKERGIEATVDRKIKNSTRLFLVFSK